MPWVKMTKDYDWRPIPQSKVRFSSGGAYLVTTAAAQAMYAAKVAIPDPDHPEIAPPAAPASGRGRKKAPKGS